MTAESELYPPRLIIQWRGNLNAVAYKIDQYIGSAWKNVGNKVENGQGYYQWRSQPIADGTDAIFRVAPTDINGNEGTAIQFEIVICCNPKAPTVIYSFTSSNAIEVSES